MNILYALPLKGGVSTDTFVLGAPFQVCADQVHSHKTKLYKSGSSRPVKQRLKFVYGHSNRRYGW